MKLSLLVLFTLISSISSSASDDRFIINNNVDDQVSKSEIHQLKKVLNQGHDYFTKIFPDFNQPKLKINIGSGSMSTGYNFETKAISFPGKKSIIHFGLKSKSVVLHELFHQLLCAYAPKNCDADDNKGDMRIVHESLADYFSYLVIADESITCFGENYYTNKKFIRCWNINFDYALVKSSYMKSSLITKYFINNKNSLKELVLKFKQNSITVKDLIPVVDHKLFHFNEQPPSLSVKFDNQPMSSLNRYKVSKGLGANIFINTNNQFRFNYPNYSIHWINAKTYITDSLCTEHSQKNNPLKFQFNNSQVVSLTRIRDWEKIFLVICQGEMVIGFDSFYLKTTP